MVSKSKWLPFNVNDTVRVRLNDYGRELHRRQQREFWEKIGRPAPEYRPPKEDADGWSRWQAWVLMRDFGQYLSLGEQMPWEPTIEIEAWPEVPAGLPIGERPVSSLLDDVGRLMNQTDAWMGTECVAPIHTPEARVARKAFKELKRRVTLRDWRTITGSTPTYGTRVLLTDGRHVTTAEYTEEDGWSIDFVSMDFGPPKAWMPLPEVPA